MRRFHTGNTATLWRRVLTLLLTCCLFLQSVPLQAIAEDAAQDADDAPAASSATVVPVAPNVRPETSPSPEENASRRASEDARHVTIAFIANVAEDDPAPATGEMPEQDYPLDGEEHALSANAYAREGFSFVGWSTTPGNFVVADDPATPDVDESLPAIAVPDGQQTSDLAWDEDVPDDPANPDSPTHAEHRDLTAAVRDDRLTLYAQWEEAQIEDGTVSTAPSDNSSDVGVNFFGSDGDDGDATTADGNASPERDKTATPNVTPSGTDDGSDFAWQGNESTVAPTDSDAQEGGAQAESAYEGIADDELTDVDSGFAVRDDASAERKTLPENMSCTLTDLTNKPGLWPALDAMATSPNGVVVEVHAPTGAFPQGTELHVRTIGRDDFLAAVEAATGERPADARAVDIAFIHDGREVEPAGARAVTVSLRMNQSIAGDLCHVVHLLDNGDIQVLGAASKMRADFEATAFSIYAIIGEGSAEKVYDRVKISFVGPEGINYGSTIIREGDILAAPLDDIPNWDDQAFVCWAWNEHDMSAYFGEEVPASLITDLCASGELLDDETNLYEVTFSAMFGDVLYVYMHQQTFEESDLEARNLVSDVIVVKKQGDVSTASLASVSYAAPEGYALSEWAEYDENGAIRRRIEADGSIDVSENTHLYPILIEGWWVSYDVGEAPGYFNSDFVTKSSSAGGTYLYSKLPKPSNTFYLGYELDGWYQDQELTKKVTRNLTVNASITLYAKWKAGKAAYRAEFYLEPAQGTPGSPQKSEYEYLKTVEYTGTTGTYITMTNADCRKILNSNWYYLSAVKNGTCTNDSSTNNQKTYRLTYGDDNDATIAADSSTVVKVYCDRIWWNLSWYGATNTNASNKLFDAKKVKWGEESEEWFSRARVLLPLFGIRSNAVVSYVSSEYRGTNPVSAQIFFFGAYTSWTEYYTDEGNFRFLLNTAQGNAANDNRYNSTYSMKLNSVGQSYRNAQLEYYEVLDTDKLDGNIDTIIGPDGNTYAFHGMKSGTRHNNSAYFYPITSYDTAYWTAYRTNGVKGKFIDVSRSLNDNEMIVVSSYAQNLTFLDGTTYSGVCCVDVLYKLNTFTLTFSNIDGLEFDTLEGQSSFSSSVANIKYGVCIRDYEPQGFGNARRLYNGIEHEFVGWFSTQEAADDPLANQDKQFDFTQNMPTGGLTAYAGWTVATHTVKLDANGGTFADGSDSRLIEGVESGGMVNLFERPTKVDHSVILSFAGWYTDTSFLEAWPEDGRVVKDIVLYARWISYETFLLTYLDRDGEDLGETYNDGTMYAYGSRVPLKGDPMRGQSDDVFVGWGTIRDDVASLVPLNLVIDGNAIGEDGVVRLYALYQSVDQINQRTVKPTVVYDSNFPESSGLDALSPPVMITALSNNGEITLLNLSEATSYGYYVAPNNGTSSKQLYVLTGWNTARDETSGELTGVTWGLGATVGVAYDDEDDPYVTVYAVWEPTREAGLAYAVLSADGSLTFFRSDAGYTDGDEGPYTDIAGNAYAGTLYAVREAGQTLAANAPPAWPDAASDAVKAAVTSVSIAAFPPSLPGSDGIHRYQALHPASTENWFAGCAALVSVALPEIDTAAATSMARMFSGCSALETLDIADVSATGSGDMTEMFAGCDALVEVTLGTGFSFAGDGSATGSARAVLPTHEGRPGEVGYWRSGNASYTAQALADAYGAALAGTWRWEVERRFAVELDDQGADEGGSGSGWVWEWYGKGVYLDEDGTDAMRMFTYANPVVVPVRAGYEFGGYWTQPGGETSGGAQLIGEQGLITNAFTSTYFDETTLDADDEDAHHVLYAWWRPTREAGLAYAVLSADGSLTFFRSDAGYTDGDEGPYTDIAGNAYAGTLFSVVEVGQVMADDAPAAWPTVDASVCERATSATIAAFSEEADGETVYQALHPASTEGWFEGCANLAWAELPGIDTEAVASMARMFAGCAALERLDLADVSCAAAEDMADMFLGCDVLAEVTLGPAFSFYGAGAGRAGAAPLATLNVPPTHDGYTGKWTNDLLVYATDALAEAFGPGLAGTWRWEAGFMFPLTGGNGEDVVGAWVATGAVCGAAATLRRRRGRRR